MKQALLNMLSSQWNLTAFAFVVCNGANAAAVQE